MHEISNLSEVLIPVALITRAALDGAARAYESGIRPTDPDTCALWDCMQVSGITTLTPTVSTVEPRSPLHRWIVVDAIGSADSVPQGPEGTAAIRAARAWVADPSGVNREVAAEAAAEAAAAFRANADPGVAYNAAAAFHAAFGAAECIAAAATLANAALIVDDRLHSKASARLRIRALATMARAGVLPVPEPDTRLQNSSISKPGIP